MPVVETLLVFWRRAKMKRERMIEVTLCSDIQQVSEEVIPHSHVIEEYKLWSVLKLRRIIFKRQGERKRTSGLTPFSSTDNASRITMMILMISKVLTLGLWGRIVTQLCRCPTWIEQCLVGVFISDRKSISEVYITVVGKDGCDIGSWNCFFVQAKNIESLPESHNQHNGISSDGYGPGNNPHYDC